MPAVIFTPASIRDLERLREFLRTKNPQAARRAGEAILGGVRILGSQPQIGRLIEGLPDEFREWPIDFGDSGYMVRYRLSVETVAILAVRHQREVGF